MRMPMQSNKPGAHGYPLLFFYMNSSWVGSFFFALFVLGGGLGLYLWWGRFSTDNSPDSLLGYALAFGGIACFLLAAISYSLTRRTRRKAIGKLNAALNWHIGFGLMGLGLLILHSFGNFNPRSGTYALYGMLALVMCGIVGKVLDRIIPRLIAREVRNALTDSGEDRIERITQKLQNLTEERDPRQQAHNNPNSLSLAGILFGDARPGESLHGIPAKAFRERSLAGISLPPSWDLAYITLEETPYELQPRSGATGQQASNLKRQMRELQVVQQALQKEQFYRYVLRYWRALHIFLALITLGLTIWHIVYALQLLIPTWMGH
ncbi:hypothetical protein KSB_19700 [Ktedonobacter robiniae]|uniref:Iron reductase n=2 Tax=Ktedonobacter robiniae TaxID=2778365 RepID=A0ABQ3ULF3_9CHLR|nr:hypothetical protein KSB_19700 [Ktedonobacter robiniae]